MGNFAQMMEGPNRIIETAKYDVRNNQSVTLHLRQVGWLIAGGPRDGDFIAWGDEREKLHTGVVFGSISPVYIEIGD